MGTERRESEPATERLLPVTGVDQQPFSGFNGDSNCNVLSDSAVTAVLSLSILVAASGSFAGGCASGYSSPVESEIMAELGLSSAEFSLFGSILTAGALVGALISGKAIDSIGRRGAMGLADVFFISGWIAIFLSQGAWSLDLGRCMVGVGGGITVYAVPVYIAEITPKDLRGAAVALSALLTCGGISVVYFIGLVIGWRALALVGMLPCVVQLLGLYFIPSSPRYLAKIGRDKECEAALKSLRGPIANISQEAAEIEEYTKALGQISQVKFLQLFKRKYAYVLTVAIGLVTLVPLGGSNGILFYADDIFDLAGVSSAIGSIGMAIIQIPACALGVYLMDKAGRRPLAMLSSAGMCLSCFLVGFSFLMEENNLLGETTPYMVLVGILGYSASFPFAMAGIAYIIISEIFPINIKASAGSLVNVASWSTSWFAAYIFSFLLEWSSSGTFFIMTSINALTILFIAKLVPETKGRTLEEIQDSIIHVLL